MIESSPRNAPARPAPGPNFVPLRYRGVAVSTVPADVPLDEPSLRAHFLGRDAYRRTRFVVARRDPDVPGPTALLRVTKESLERAIGEVRVGGRLSDVGHAVQTWVEQHGFSVVREFVGHGIGEKLHEDPQIPNYGQPGRGPKLVAGMVLAIEPMVAMGKPETRVLGDGWTAVTRDGSLAAHFEHTVAVRADGPLVLTARAGDAVAARTGAH